MKLTFRSFFTQEGEPRQNQLEQKASLMSRADLEEAVERLGSVKKIKTEIQMQLDLLKSYGSPTSATSIKDLEAQIRHIEKLHPNLENELGVYEQKLKSLES